MKQGLIKKLSFIPPATYLIIIMVIYFGLTTPNYFTGKNCLNIIIQAMPFLVAACGQTLIVLIQGTDLSIGSNMDLAMVTWFLLMQSGVNTYFGMGLILLLSLMVGIVNGAMVSYLGMPPFIATLGMANICKSLALTLSNGSSVTFSNPLYKVVAKGNIAGIPIIVLLGLLVFIVFIIILNFGKIGSRIRALGGNEEALHVAGYNTKFAKIQIFGLCGLVSGVAAILLACRIGAANPSGADGYEFNTVAAVLLGGTSMVEGRGNVFGTFFGVILIQILKYSLVLKNVSAIYQKAIIGGVVLFAVIFDAWLKKREEA